VRLLVTTQRRQVAPKWLDPKVVERLAAAVRVEEEEPVGALSSVCADKEVDQKPFGLAACRYAAPRGVRRVRVGGAMPGALVEVEVDKAVHQEASYAWVKLTRRPESS